VGPWEAFTNGSFKAPRRPAITLKTTLSGDVVDTVSNAADAALGPLDELASTLLSKDTWFRIGKGALGFNLAMIGVAGLGLIVALRVSKSAPVKSAVKVAKKIPKVPILGGTSMFDNLTAQCQEMIRPHAIRVGQTAEAYALRIIARLEGIQDALQDEGPERFATDTANAVADATGIADVIFDTRPGQSMELLSLTGSGGAAAGTGCAVYHTDPTNELNLLHVLDYGTGSPIRSRQVNT
jgi:hypothetical protein